MKKCILWLAAALLLSGCAQRPAAAPAVPDGAKENPPAAATASAVPTTVPPAGENAAAPDAALFDLRADVDAGVQAALYAYFRGVLYDADWFDARAGAAKTKICVYAARAYRDGTLAVADFYMDGELAPDLFYIVDGAVQCATQGSDCWSINYTRLLGDTIVYGESFAWDNRPLATTAATAVFTDGRTETQPLVAAQDGPQPGFLFVAAGESWLSTLTLYDGEKTVVDQDSGPFVINGLLNRFHPDSALCQWLRFSPMLDKAARERHLLDLASSVRHVAQVDGTAQGLLRWYKDAGAAFPDLWRTVNCGMPETVESARPVTLDGLDRAAVEAVYWVELARDDGTPEGQAAAVQRTDLGLDSQTPQAAENATCWSTPGAPGHYGLYLLVLDTGDCYETALYNVVRGE